MTTPQKERVPGADPYFTLNLEKTNMHSNHYSITTDFVLLMLVHFSPFKVKVSVTKYCFVEGIYMNCSCADISVPLCFIS